MSAQGQKFQIFEKKLSLGVHSPCLVLFKNGVEDRHQIAMYRLFIDRLFKLLLSNRSGRTFSNSSGVLIMNNFEIQCNMALLMGGLRKSSFVTMKKTSTKYSIKCSSKIDTSSIPPVYPQYTPSIPPVYPKCLPSIPQVYPWVNPDYSLSIPKISVPNIPQVYPEFTSSIPRVYSV